MDTQRLWECFCLTGEPLVYLLYQAALDQESGGGVTLSGGEVMCADMDMVEELTRRLYDAGISVMIDTCGHAPYARFQRILPYVDGFLYDIKSADPLVHARYTGKDNALILDNLESEP